MYTFFQRHKALRLSLLLALTAVMVALVTTLGYKEDISDFLPLGTEDREAMNVYQDVSGAGRLFVIFHNPGDADRTTEAIDCFRQELEQRDTAGWTESMTVQVDMEKMQEVQEFVYSNIPYFLTDSDYRRMDSLLATPGFIDTKLQQDREALMFPSAGMMTDNIGRDPLGLFTPVLKQLQGRGGGANFETYEGYIFTADMKRAVAMMTSPFGNAETEHNAQLLALIDSAVAGMNKTYPDVKATIAGGPQVAVGNAQQIRHDSIIAIALAVTLIMVLLVRAFRSARNIFLILLSTGWGWLFALSGMALLHDSVSVIVIGISSVILGIAVNYPLHLVAHLSHEPDVRRALRDITAPLLIGNVTTVGAFLALVPLHSVALSDLGLFASLLLVGTIFFVLVFLPHHVRAVKTDETRKDGLLARLAGIQLENKPWLIAVTAMLTLLFAWQSLYTEFDTNLGKINYMTDSQREDMDYFQRMMAADSAKAVQTVFVISSGETMNDALRVSASRQGLFDSIAGRVSARHEGVVPFLSTDSEQARRLGMWRDFIKRHSEQLHGGLTAAALQGGFAPDAFSAFKDIIGAAYNVQPYSHFSPLTSELLAGSISIDKASGRCHIVDRLYVPSERTDEVRQSVKGAYTWGDINSALASSLSNDFNYIGWVCSAIVFLFLLFSFGRIELAVIAFLPMAVSWLWILGIMALLGVKFNIVNIILATFIFGQGDDYTIFMTEGCQYEYAYRRRMLASYKNSIVLSALIMFIGIGTLIVARHPALHSLAEVTIIGMSSVVFMAWLIPPLAFKWLTHHRDGSLRLHPLTLALLLRRLCGKRTMERLPEERNSRTLAPLVYGRYIYKGMSVQRAVKANMKRNACFAATVDCDYHDVKELTVSPCGYGEEALMIALAHPDITVRVSDPDSDKIEILKGCAEGIAENIVFNA